MSSRENLVIDQYISGLGDIELKKYVQFAHPLTLDKAISLAVEFEAFEGAHNKTLLKPRNFEQDLLLNQSTVRAVQKEGFQKTSNSYASDESVLSEITKTMKELQSAVNELKLANESSSKLKNTVNSNIRCCTCGKSGHISRQCTERPHNFSQQNDKSNSSRQFPKNNPNAGGLSLRPKVQSRRY
ncbi:uncharacterized protein LOC133189204 [Saccostrea echinata]|uniref:uncharacterized protein LOC133189204 n=1 Tax=Saccostrea echinata TaxID=191078 RepID=UPI002A83BE33|nr:uncharacterized protein LOC133189204 [Saccostrea echinata]